MIRELVPKEKLLEWHVEDGWEGLCEFLGKKVPDQKFPRANDKDGFRIRVEDDLEKLGEKAVLNMLGLLLMCLSLGVYFWFR